MWILTRKFIFSFTIVVCVFFCSKILWDFCFPFQFKRLSLSRQHFWLFAMLSALIALTTNLLIWFFILWHDNFSCCARLELLFTFARNLHFLIFTFYVIFEQNHVVTLTNGYKAFSSPFALTSVIFTIFKCQSLLIFWLHDNSLTWRWWFVFKNCLRQRIWIQSAYHPENST